MFSYIFMKILERRPRSYDGRISKLSGGRILEIKKEVASAVPPGSLVLEIGCGTGELAAMLVAAGSRVDGFDLSDVMVAASQERMEHEKLYEKLSLRHMGVDAMDGLPDGAYDAVVSTLVFSELTDDERRFALEHAARVLKPGGHLVIADEVVPRSMSRGWTHALFRLPLLLATFLLSGDSTEPVKNLAGEISSAGFSIIEESRSHGDAFAIVVAHKTVDK